MFPYIYVKLPKAPELESPDVMVWSSGLSKVIVWWRKRSSSCGGSNQFAGGLPVGLVEDRARDSILNPPLLCQSKCTVKIRTAVGQRQPLPCLSYKSNL